MKKLLAILSAITVIAVSSVCSVSAETVEVYDVPDNITTINEFREYLKDNNITEKVWVTRDDYLMLFEQLTIDELRELVAYFNMESENISDRLVEYLRIKGIDENKIDSFVKNFYIGELQLYEKNEVRPVSPVVNNNFDYCSPSKPIELLTETSGTFKSGVTYFYNEETKGLIFDGNNVLSDDDYVKATLSFDEEFIFIGKDVIIDTFEGTDVSSAVMDTQTLIQIYGCEDTPLKTIFTYEGSDFSKKVNSYSEKYSVNENDYIYYTVDDNTDPYKFVNPMKKLPVVVKGSGLLWKDNLTGTSPIWNFRGTTEAGVLTILSLYDTSFTLNDVLEISKDYNPTEVCLGETNMSVLPAELQNCETIEEAEAELLRLINEAKEEEQSTEETTEATVPTEVTEPTEAVEENTAETIVESVEILADEIAEDKTEITLGDVNGNGNVDVRDCSFIAREIAGGKAADLPDSADYNKDGVKNIRDAAILAKELA